MSKDNPWRDDMAPGQLVDRRSEGDRRKADNPDFFARGGIERRRDSDPRQKEKGIAQSITESRPAGPGAAVPGADETAGEGSIRG